MTIAASKVNDDQQHRKLMTITASKVNDDQQHRPHEKSSPGCWGNKCIETAAGVRHGRRRHYLMCLRHNLPRRSVMLIVERFTMESFIVERFIVSILLFELWSLVSSLPPHPPRWFYQVCINRF